MNIILLLIYYVRQKWRSVHCSADSSCQCQIVWSGSNLTSLLFSVFLSQLADSDRADARRVGACSFLVLTVGAFSFVAVIFVEIIDFKLV